MSQKNELETFDTLREIIQGFTPFNDLYIKHLTFRDEIDIRSFYEGQLETLVEIPKEEDQLELLMAKGIWDKKKEGDLNLKRVRLSAAESTLPNLLVKAQQDPLKKQIEELKSDIFTLDSERSEYMGITREVIANRHAYENVLFLSVFKDSEFKEPHFPNKEKDLDEISSGELFVVQEKVADVREKCGIPSCKKVACSYHVQSMVNCLPEDNEYKLIDRPVHTFSVAQINLVQYCSVFRKIFSRHTIPEDIANNPDKILEFPKQAKKLEEMRQKQSGSKELNSGKSYMGATSDEMGNMGMKGVDIHHLLNKSGKKSLSKEDLL